MVIKYTFSSAPPLVLKQPIINLSPLCFAQSSSVGVRRTLWASTAEFMVDLFLNACNSGGSVAGATPTRLFVDLNKLHSSVRRRGPAVDAGSRCQNDLVASDKGQDGGTPRAPLNDAANLPRQRLHGDKRTPRVSLVLFDTEVKYFIAAI